MENTRLHKHMKVKGNTRGYLGHTLRTTLLTAHLPFVLPIIWAVNFKRAATAVVFPLPSPEPAQNRDCKCS